MPKTYTVFFTKINEQQVEADSEEEAIQKADPSEFDWSENNTASQVEVELEEESEF